MNMESILIVYKSRTGFTKKYVDWIAETTACQIVSLDQINNVDINNFDIVVYGAGMHAGRIKGLNEFKKKLLELDCKKIIVFATGGAPYDESIVSIIKSKNFTENELNNIDLFYFQSGISYEKMGLVDKTIMKTYSKVLELKNNK